MQNWNDFDSTLRQVAEIDLKVLDAAQARDRAVLAAQDAYGKATAPLFERKAELEDELADFYRSRRAEVEKDGKRSIDLTFGRAGMRRGNPTLGLRKGWKWEKVLDAIKKRWKSNKSLLEALIKTKESPNKDQIKTRLNAQELAEIGLRIDQEDEFFYETFPDKVKQAA